MSAASGGRCAVAAAAVPEVGKDLKVCRPRMDALEARSLDLAPGGGRIIASQLALKGRNEPKGPIYIIYFAVYFYKYLNIILI